MASGTLSILFIEIPCSKHYAATIYAYFQFSLLRFPWLRRRENITRQETFNSLYWDSVISYLMLGVKPLYFQFSLLRFWVMCFNAVVVNPNTFNSLYWDSPQTEKTKYRKTFRFQFSLLRFSSSWSFETGGSTGRSFQFSLLRFLKQTSIRSKSHPS